MVLEYYGKIAVLMVLLFYLEFTLQYNVRVHFITASVFNIFWKSNHVLLSCICVSCICSIIFFILILCLYFTLNFIAGQYADILCVMCAKHYHEVNTRVPVNKRKKLKRCTFLLRVRMGIVCDLRGTIQCYL